MEKKEFLDYLKNKFKMNGFVSKKNILYLMGEEVICSIKFQGSSYGKGYYINFCFFIKDGNTDNPFPSFYDNDIYGRIRVRTISQRYNGQTFMGVLILYEDYKTEDLDPYIDAALKDYLLPAVREGKQFILKNKNIYFHYSEEVENKLKA